MHAPRQLILALLSFVAGGILWWAFGRGAWNSPLILALLVVQLMIVALPPINGFLSRQLDQMRRPAGITRALTALAIGCGGAAYLYLSAVEQGRDFFPKFHDESMHLIQARLLSHGRLWLPAHALPQFFETFHIFVTPIYAPMQFPGTSLLYVPAMWLGLPYWVTPLVIGGITLALMYLVVAHILDDVMGILAAVMLLGVIDFRYQSLMVLSYPASLMLGLAIILCWLHWARRPTIPRAMLVGFFGAWAAITRPPDAVCFVLPVAFAMLWKAFRGGSPEMPRIAARKAAMMLGGLLLAASPLIALQLAFNRGVTGSVFRTPHALYVSRFHPGLGYLSFADHPGARPQTELAQKLDYYDSFVLPSAARYSSATAVREWVNHRLPIVFRGSLPSLLLLWLLPAGLLGLKCINRWVVFSIFPLFVLLYAPSRNFDAQYALVSAIAMIPLAILGMLTLAKASQRVLSKSGAIAAEPVGVLLLLTISLTALPQLNPAGVTEQYATPTLRAVQAAESTIQGRAVIFFKYRHGDNVHEEPVYNIAAADIDSNRIVRAHDLGPVENFKLFQYYHQRQPDRRFYRFDRRERALVEIDPVAEHEAAMSHDGGSAL